jgi:hypothetical protein
MHAGETLPDATQTMVYMEYAWIATALFRWFGAVFGSAIGPFGRQSYGRKA